MALRDHYDTADILSSFSWVAMSQKARVASLSKLYLDDEAKIRKQSRNYDGPTKGTVGVFIKSHYTPPRGMSSTTINDVLLEITRQSKVREERAKNKPWKPPGRFSKLEKSQRRSMLGARWNRLSRRRYRTLSRYSKTDSREYATPAVVGVTTVGGCLLIVDAGAYQVQPRVYLKCKATNKEKLVVLLLGGVKSITDALLLMAPERALRGMFDGRPILLDFAGEGFLVDGQTYPWRNVQRIYRGRKALRTTAANPVTKR